MSDAKTKEKVPETATETSAGEKMRASVLAKTDTKDRIVELDKWVKDAKRLGKEKEPKEPEEEKDEEDADPKKPTIKEKIAAGKKTLEAKKEAYVKAKEAHEKARKDREDILVTAHALTGDMLGLLKIQISEMETKKKNHTPTELAALKKHEQELYKINATILDERGISISKTTAEARARFGRADFVRQGLLIGGLTAAATWAMVKGRKAWKWIAGTTIASLAALHLWRGAREERLKKDLEAPKIEPAPAPTPKLNSDAAPASTAKTADSALDTGKTLVA